jgi:sugar/nucleoside kinase (ribokinase family)
MMYDVTVIGEIYLDHVFSGFAAWPGPGEEIFTDQYAWELGGGAVTTACALSRLGRSVQLIGLVGEDQFPMVAARLAVFGVSTENITRTRERSGVTVSISTTKDRSFFTYRGANRRLAEHLRQNTSLLHIAASAKHVHLAMPLTPDDGMAILPELKRHEATLSIDVGHQVKWLEDERSLEIVRAIDYVMPNEKEAVILAGSPEQYLERCASLGVRHALVKLGSAGAVMLSDGVEYKAAPPEVETLDTTGAGDAFDAGFIDAVLAGLTPKQCIEHGCVCGALSTRAAGALEALPTRTEAEAACEENYAT